MWGCRPEHRHKCSLQRPLRCTRFTCICCLMRLNACLTEFISLQILLGIGDTVMSVFVDSPVLQFVLNYLCSILQPPRQQDGQLQTVPGTGLFFAVKKVIAGVCHHAEVRTVTPTFHWHFRGLSHTYLLCLASLILLFWLCFSLQIYQRKTMTGIMLSKALVRR